MPLGAVCSLVLSTALAPQEPAAIEVIGPAGEPSRALREQLKKGEDDLILFDVGLGVREAVVNLHERWGAIEHERAGDLRALTRAIVERMGHPDDAARAAVGNVAGVAHAVLVAAAERDRLTADQLAEVADVEAAREGTIRFMPSPAPRDWRDARPRGGYARDSWGGELTALFRATVYLRTYLAAWPPELAACWRAQAAACAASPGADFATVEQAMTILFGCGARDPGLVEPAVAPDLVWLHAQQQPAASVQDRLSALFAAVPMREPKAMSDGVLRLCHELGAARASDPLFAALAPAQWQAKWLDAAMFAYAGLREVDCCVRAVGREKIPEAPRIVVEPLPEVWHALRWFDRRHTDLRAVRWPGDDKGGSWVDPVLDALALQQRGEDLPPKLHERLLHMLLWSFEAPDLLLGIATEIEGAGMVRRAMPQLVRVPVVWRGETKKALALRLFLEQERPGGKWEPVR